MPAKTVSSTAPVASEGKARKSPAAAASAAAAFKRTTQPPPKPLPPQGNESGKHETELSKSSTAAAKKSVHSMTEKTTTPKTVTSLDPTKAMAAAVGAVNVAKAKAAQDLEKKEAQARLDKQEAIKEAKAQVAAMEASRENKTKATTERIQKEAKALASAMESVNQAKIKADAKVAEMKEAKGKEVGPKKMEAKAGDKAESKPEAKKIETKAKEIEKLEEKTNTRKMSEPKEQTTPKASKSKEPTSTDVKKTKLSEPKESSTTKELISRRPVHTSSDSSLAVPRPVQRSVSPARRETASSMNSHVLSPMPMRTGVLNHIPLLQHQRSSSDAPTVGNTKPPPQVMRRNSVSPKRVTSKTGLASSRLVVPQNDKSRPLSTDSLRSATSSGSDGIYSSTDSGADAIRAQSRTKQKAPILETHYQSAVPSNTNGAYIFHPGQSHGLARTTLRDKRSKTTIGFINPFHGYEQQARKSIELPSIAQPPPNVPLTAAKLASGGSASVKSPPIVPDAIPPPGASSHHRGFFGRVKQKLKMTSGKDGPTGNAVEEGMTIKTTMRKQHRKKSFNEDKPWKHHADAVKLTESERKRYEGMWAANRGSHIPYQYPEEQMEDMEYDEDEDTEEDEEEDDDESEYESDGDESEFSEGDTDLESMDEEDLEQGSKIEPPNGSGPVRESLEIERGPKQRESLESERPRMRESLESERPRLRESLECERPSVDVAKERRSSADILSKLNHPRPDNADKPKQVTLPQSSTYSLNSTAKRPSLPESKQGSVSTMRGSTSEDPDPTQTIHGLVVRELWRRSRLADDTLRQIWDLVDRRHDGCLDRESFLVGMWLVDQCLYGRKLPPKIDDTLWSSVGRLNVRIKIRRRKEERRAEKRQKKAMKMSSHKKKKKSKKSKSKSEKKHHKRASENNDAGGGTVPIPRKESNGENHQPHESVTHLPNPAGSSAGGLSKIGGIVGIGKKKTKVGESSGLAVSAA